MFRRTSLNEEMLKRFLMGVENPEQQIPYKELKSIILKYMTIEEFLHGAIGKMMYNPGEDLNYHSNLINIDRIAEYRIKTAKNGKVKDPRTKAIIDFTDILMSYTRKPINSFERDYIDYDREQLKVIYKYFGKLSLPFDNCIIFTQVPDKVGQVVEITHDLRGNYSGNFYLFAKFGGVLQAKVDIKRKDNYWQITFTLPFRQKPLGTPINNIGVIVNMLALCPYQYRDELMQHNSHMALEHLTASDMFTGLICILESLDSYKSKFIYKVHKNTINVYLYTDKLNVRDYIGEHYPGFDYEQLDSWIVNGYWEFCKGQSGKDKNGKLITGMNWVVPYETESTDVEVNGQQAKSVKIHAIERAKQRYNLDFTNEDLKQIADECLKTGKILSIKDAMGRVKTSKSCYRIKYQNNILDVALDYGLDKSVRVATFLPKPKDVNYTIIDSKQYNEIQNDINK